MSRRQESAATTEAADWIEWDGKDGHGPLAPREIVEVKVRSGFVHLPMSVGFWAGDTSATHSNWLHDGEDCDIVAYRIVGAAA